MELDKTARIYIKGKNLKLCINKLKKSKAEMLLRMRKNAKWIVFLASMIGFIMLSKAICTNKIFELDISIFKFISENLTSDFMTKIAIFITNFGSAIFLILLSLVFLIIVKNKKIGVFVALNLEIEAWLNTLLKNIIERPRPFGINKIIENGFSFPSGHSMAAMAFYGFLIFLIFRYIKNKKLKWSLSILLSFLIVLIGLSRIYLGVHYLSDVIGAFLFSISYLIIYTSLLDKYVLKLKK